MPLHLFDREEGVDEASTLQEQFKLRKLLHKVFWQFVLFCAALGAQRQKFNQTNWKIPEDWSILLLRQWNREGACFH